MDINGDGITDLIIPNQYAGDVSMRLGLGDGSFGPETRWATGAAPWAAAMADLNGDGRLDLIASDYNSDPPVLDVRLGAAGGGFGPVTTVSVGMNPYRIATLDVNRDGIVDVLVTLAGQNALSVLIGKGDGTFLPERQYPTGVAAVWSGGI